MTWPTTHYINGDFTSDTASIAVENPATEEVIATVADATPAQAMACLDAAAEASKQWAATEPRQRAELLRAAFELIQQRADLFAETIHAEMGKPLEEAHAEVNYGAEFFRWFSEETNRTRGSYTQAPSGGNRMLTFKRPVGPVLAITPWNFPLAMATRKIGPALAAGCTSVLKPAALTPLTALLLMQVLHDIGLPTGVVNCFVASDAIATTAPLIADPRLRKLTFTGSTAVGSALLRQAADNVLRTSMELGGNAPLLVLADADVDRAVEGAFVAKMRNVGQACTAANRFIIDRRVADEFVAKFAAKLASYPHAPLITSQAVDNVLDLIADAQQRGAQLVAGGRRLDRAGHFLEPTVLIDVDPQARCIQEEIFGPLAPVMVVDSTEEAIALANDSQAGLMSYVFTENVDEALRTCERLDYGLVGLNTGLVSNPAAPFGGVKSSGLGREGGQEGIDEYLETVYVGIGLK